MYWYGTMNVAAAGSRWARSLSGYGCGDGGTASSGAGTSKKLSSGGEALPCLVVLELDSSNEEGARFWPSTVRGKSVSYKAGSASSRPFPSPKTPAGWGERLQQDVAAALIRLQTGIEHGIIEPRYVLGIAWHPLTLPH